MLATILLGREYWVGFVTWMILGALGALLWRGIRNEAEREKRKRARRYRNHERRLRALEEHVFGNQEDGD